MQTKMNVSTTLKAEEGSRAESEEKDTSEGVVSFAPGKKSTLYSKAITKITDLKQLTPQQNLVWR